MLDSGLRSKMSQFLKLKRQQKSDFPKVESGKNARKERKTSSTSSSKRTTNEQQGIENKTGQNRASNSVNNQAATQHNNHANIIRRIISLLQVFAWTQIGSCTNFSSKFPSSNSI